MLKYFTMSSKKQTKKTENIISSGIRGKKRIVLKFPPTRLQTPITYMLAKEYDIASNILRAEIAPEETGKLVMEMEGPEELLDKAIVRIKEFGIEVTEIARKVIFDMDKCIHCGACISVCLAGALKFDSEYKLQFIEPKCTVCEMCVTSCPVNIINIDI